MDKEEIKFALNTLTFETIVTCENCDKHVPQEFTRMDNEGVDLCFECINAFLTTQVQGQNKQLKEYRRFIKTIDKPFTIYQQILNENIKRLKKLQLNWIK